MGPFDSEANDSGRLRPRVFGHLYIGRNLDRYKRTSGLNNAINTRQFIRPDATSIEPGAQFAADSSYRYPDVTYDERAQFREGGMTFELHHARGETEDATWTWVPERKMLFTGDLFGWYVPNAGNPQKVQRFVGDWAAALREMEAIGAEVMVPGHGCPIFGADRIELALSDTADLLESIEAQTLAQMNRGATLDAVLQAVRIPEELIAKPYLRPIYEDPAFLVRSVWRLYGGWYDGEPDNLLPAPRAELAGEWVGMAGGLASVLKRARQLLADGSVGLACHLIEAAVAAEPKSREAHELRAEVYEARVKLESSAMARGIFTFAAKSSRMGRRDFFESREDS
jgi:alkyl sulfatase BDS1-like metallo-beta-lactamase superfamily hydrolase